MKKITQRDIIIALGRGETYAEIMKTAQITRAALYNHLKRMREKGLEPTDVNACRRYVMGPHVKLHKQDFLRTIDLTPAQLQMARLVDSKMDIFDIACTIKVGLQSARNLAAASFKAMGIIRINKPERVWRGQLRAYLLERYPPNADEVTMSDPFFH